MKSYIQTMIDTITLSLDQSLFKIMDHERFEPSTEHLFIAPFYAFKKYKSCKQWPTYRENAKYLPRLTVTKYTRHGGYSITLYIEFSIPKLVFNNNFEEVTDADFDRVICLLYECLYDMGIYIDNIEILKKAGISKIHYSKNILLESYLDLMTFMDMLKKVNISKVYGITQTNYLNEGQTVRYRTNEFEITFYDKKREIEQAMKSE